MTCIREEEDRNVEESTELKLTYLLIRVTVPLKIFMGYVHCLAMPPNDCVRALYGRFRPLPPS